MDTPQIEQQIRHFVVDTYLFGRNEGLKDNDDSFIDSGIIDSTGVLELVGFLQDTYGITVEDDELITDNLDSIKKVSRYLRDKLSILNGAPRSL